MKGLRKAVYRIGAVDVSRLGGLRQRSVLGGAASRNDPIHSGTESLGMLSAVNDELSGGMAASVLYKGTLAVRVVRSVRIDRVSPFGPCSGNDNISLDFVPQGIRDYQEARSRLFWRTCDRQWARYMSSAAGSCNYPRSEKSGSMVLGASSTVCTTRVQWSFAYCNGGGRGQG